MKCTMLFTLLTFSLTPGWSPCLFAQSTNRCVQVGGAVSTNFLDPTTTLGTATGDLKGAIGVTVLSLKENPDGTLPSTPTSLGDGIRRHD